MNTAEPNIKFNKYIRIIGKQVHPDMGWTKSGLDTTNVLINAVGLLIAKKAVFVAATNKRATITSSNIMAAIRLVLPGELAKHAVSESTKALVKFENSGEMRPPGVGRDGRGRPRRFRRNRAGKLVRWPVPAGARAGIHFPPSRARKLIQIASDGNLQTKRACGRIEPAASVYLAATLEYICAEFCELGGNATRDARRQLMKNRDLFKAISWDEELSALMEKLNLFIPDSGVTPNIHAFLFRKKKRR